MRSEKILSVTPRAFTRREKTSIRQDVKRFQKIGRDHGCTVLEDYAEFVAERLRYQDNGDLTTKSFELIRGLGAYFGDALLDHTPMVRIAGEMHVNIPQGRDTENLMDSHPGWLLGDQITTQSVIVPLIITDRVTTSMQWTESLDDIFDEIVDWNQGYLTRDDIRTPWVLGPDLEVPAFWAA